MLCVYEHTFSALMEPAVTNADSKEGIEAVDNSEVWMFLLVGYGIKKL